MSPSHQATARTLIAKHGDNFRALAGVVKKNSFARIVTTTPDRYKKLLPDWQIISLSALLDDPKAHVKFDFDKLIFDQSALVALLEPSIPAP